MRHHPDQSSTGFDPSNAWCIGCSEPIRTFGAKWYGAHQVGPFCSTACMRESSNEGDLPDWVEEMEGNDAPDVPTTTFTGSAPHLLLQSEQLPRDFNLKVRSLYGDVVE